MLSHRANAPPAPRNEVRGVWPLPDPADQPGGLRFRPPPRLVQLDFEQVLRRSRGQHEVEDPMDPVGGSGTSSESRSPSPAPNAVEPIPQLGKRTDAGAGLIFSGRLVSVPGGRSLELERVIDLAQLGYCDRTWLVSRKRNKNLFDLVTSWKRRLLNEAAAADELGNYMDEGI